MVAGDGKMAVDLSFCQACAFVKLDLSGKDDGENPRVDKKYG